MSVPQATPDTERYWAAAAEGRLEIQRCNACGRHYFYPRPFCRYCASADVDWVQVSGRARLASYVVTNRPLRGFEPVSPVIAIVELAEGPRMMTNIVEVDPDPDLLTLDMPLQVRFHRRDGVTLPVFAPRPCLEVPSAIAGPRWSLTPPPERPKTTSIRAAPAATPGTTPIPPLIERDSETRPGDQR